MTSIRPCERLRAASAAPAVHRAAGIAAVVEAVADQSPALVGLALDVGLGGLALVVEGVELLFEAGCRWRRGCRWRIAGSPFGVRASWRRLPGRGGERTSESRRFSASMCPKPLAAGSQAEEAMAVPACAGDRLGDPGQASIGPAVPGVAVLEDRHPFELAAPFPRERRPRPQVFAIAHGGRPVGERRGVGTVRRISRSLQLAQEPGLEIAERRRLKPVGEDARQQPRRQMGGRRPAQMITPLQKKLGPIEIRQAREEGRQLDPSLGLDSPGAPDGAPPPGRETALFRAQPSLGRPAGPRARFATGSRIRLRLRDRIGTVWLPPARRPYQSRQRRSPCARSDRPSRASGRSGRTRSHSRACGVRSAQPAPYAAATRSRSRSRRSSRRAFPAPR